ncbi:aldehyde dehydrogenase family protein [Streptomyces sp. NRRL F-5650]|uniref:aldehyde dehydrogenase family protein n=1 Tax=Streptomyces sp. NRRL F-5650 TaxID=1463868 RepID=UPI002D21C667|nr:aldehyde dehydrogenase family protein [Streptomyces sp. NRRL F-5650]
MGDLPRTRGRGPGGGFYVAPTVFANAGNAQAIAREETSRPVLSVIPHTDEDEAVAHRQRLGARPREHGVDGRDEHGMRENPPTGGRVPSHCGRTRPPIRHRAVLAPRVPARARAHPAAPVPDVA